MWYQVLPTFPWCDEMIWCGVIRPWVLLLHVSSQLVFPLICLMGGRFPSFPKCLLAFYKKSYFTSPKNHLDDIKKLVSRIWNDPTSLITKLENGFFRNFIITAVNWSVKWLQGYPPKTCKSCGSFDMGPDRASVV